MPFITRLVIDVVTEEEMPERRQIAWAKGLSENVHLIQVEKTDGVVNVEDKNIRAHTHVATSGGCGHCAYLSQDDRDGENVS